MANRECKPRPKVERLPLSTIIQTHSQASSPRSVPAFASCLLDRSLPFGFQLDGALVVEHDSCDSDSLECSGTVVASWMFDKSGFSSISTDAANPGEVYRNKWRKHVLRFCVPDGDSEAIVNDFTGLYRAPVDFCFIASHVRPATELN